MLREEQLHDPGEKCPWICTVALVMSDMQHSAQDSNKCLTGRTNKALPNFSSPSFAVTALLLPCFS